MTHILIETLLVAAATFLCGFACDEDVPLPKAEVFIEKQK